jgi:hypothetical protein
MIMSVSTLIIFSGAATPSRVVNLSITVPMVGSGSAGRSIAKSGRAEALPDAGRQGGALAVV